MGGRVGGWSVDWRVMLNSTQDQIKLKLKFQMSFAKFENRRCPKIVRIIILILAIIQDDKNLNILVQLGPKTIVLFDQERAVDCRSCNWKDFKQGLILKWVLKWTDLFISKYFIIKTYKFNKSPEKRSHLKS